MWEREKIRHFLLEITRLVQGNFCPSPQEMYNSLVKRSDGQQIIDYVGAKRLPDLISWPVFKGGELTDIGILRHLLAGNIVIEPFDIRRLQSNGYDVSLGEFYYTCTDLNREQRKYPKVKDAVEDQIVFNPADPENISDFFSGPNRGLLVGELIEKRIEVGRGIARNIWYDGVRFLEGLEREDRIIILPPNRMILGHTIEFIGGRHVVDTMISGKSTTGRLGIEVCSDANKGDVGYTGRWTLEIANKHPRNPVILVVGQPIATITFFEVEEPVQTYEGRYNGQNLINDWKPDLMLPKWKKK